MGIVNKTHMLFGVPFFKVFSAGAFGQYWRPCNCDSLHSVSYASNDAKYYHSRSYTCETGRYFSAAYAQEDKGSYMATIQNYRHSIRRLLGPVERGAGRWGSGRALAPAKL